MNNSNETISTNIMATSCEVTNRVLDKLIYALAEPENPTFNRDIENIRSYINGILDVSANTTSPIILKKIVKEVEERIEKSSKGLILKNEKYTFYLNTVADIVVRDYREFIYVDENTPFPVFHQLFIRLNSKDVEGFVAMLYSRYGDKSKPLEELGPMKQYMYKLYDQFSLENFSIALAKNLAGCSDAEMKEKAKDYIEAIAEKCKNCLVQNYSNVDRESCYNSYGCRHKMTSPIVVLCNEIMVNAIELAKKNQRRSD